jgi:hypothetical protein
LRDLLEQLDFKENPIRKTAAWFSEKFTRAKLSIEDPTDGKLAYLEKHTDLNSVRCMAELANAY